MHINNVIDHNMSFCTLFPPETITTEKRIDSSKCVIISSADRDPSCSRRCQPEGERRRNVRTSLCFDSLLLSLCAVPSCGSLATALRGARDSGNISADKIAERRKKEATKRRRKKRRRSKKIASISSSFCSYHVNILLHVVL